MNLNIYDLPELFVKYKNRKIWINSFNYVFNHIKPFISE